MLYVGVFIGANCLIGIGFGIENFLFLGQDWDWYRPLFSILRSLDEFKGWILVRNAKRGLALKMHFDWTSGS